MRSHPPGRANNEAFDASINQGRALGGDGPAGSALTGWRQGRAATSAQRSAPLSVRSARLSVRSQPSGGPSGSAAATGAPLCPAAVVSHALARRRPRPSPIAAPLPAGCLHACSIGRRGRAIQADFYPWLAVLRCHLGRAQWPP